MSTDTRPVGINVDESKTFKEHWTPEDDALLLRMVAHTNAPLWVVASQIPGGSTDHDCRLRLAILQQRDAEERGEGACILSEQDTPRNPS